MPNPSVLRGEILAATAVCGFLGPSVFPLTSGLACQKFGVVAIIVGAFL